MLVFADRVRCIARSIRWKTLSCCGVAFVTVTVPSAFVTSCTGAAAGVLVDVVALCPVVFVLRDADVVLDVAVRRAGVAPIRTPADPLTL